MSALTESRTEAPGTPEIDRKRSIRARMKDHWWGYAFILPVGLGLLVFYMIPAVVTFVLSFSQWGDFGGNKFNGLANYTALFTDPIFWMSLRNTLVYTVIGLLTLPIAIFTAQLLNRPGLRGVAIYRALFFVPYVTLPVASGMVWKWMYNGQYGLLNQFLSIFGVDGTYWAANPQTVVLAVGAVQVWSQVGYYLIIFLAGIKSIPVEYSEAAEIDGAGPVRRFFSVTLPLLTPSIFFCSIICVIATLQIFDLLFIIVQATGVNPAFNSAQSVVGLFYQRAFVENDRGGAAAMAFVLMAIIAVLTFIQFRMQRKWVTYD